MLGNKTFAKKKHYMSMRSAIESLVKEGLWWNELPASNVCKAEPRFLIWIPNGLNELSAVRLKFFFNPIGQSNRGFGAYSNPGTQQLGTQNKDFGGGYPTKLSAGFWFLAQASSLNEIKQRSGIIADLGNSFGRQS